MRHSKHNDGFSLIEILVAMVLLGLIVVPITSSLLVSHRINAKTEQLLQAQLAVSSAAEIANAEGIDAIDTNNLPVVVDKIDGNADLYPNLTDNYPEYYTISSVDFPEIWVLFFPGGKP